MDIIKPTKKFRMVCYDIMDGHEDAIKILETYEKYPHQIAAVKAEVAYFNMDYASALSLDLETLPFFEEWYFSNVGDEHMAAMAFAAIKLHCEREVFDALIREQARILAEGGRQPRSKYAEKMKTYIQNGVLPHSDAKEMSYQDPPDAKSIEELTVEVKAKNKKLDIESVAGKDKLFYACCTSGTAEDAITIYEQINNEKLGELPHQNAIVRYLYLGEREKALQTAERLATLRLWSVASPTQVRPMRFFQLPYMLDFLSDERALARIRSASFVDDGSIIRK